MSEVSLYLGLILISFLVYLFIGKILDGKGKRYARGPYGFPVFGHLPLFGKHPPTTFMNWWKSYGDVFSIRMGSWNTVVVNGYNAVKAAAEHSDTFSGRPPFVSKKLQKNKNNEETLAFSQFSPTYLKQRQLTSKALRLFTSKRPEFIEELISNESTMFAESLINKYGDCPGHLEFDVQIFIVRVIYQFLYGRGKHVDIEKHVKVIIKALDEVNELSALGNMMDVLPWLQYFMPWRIKKFTKLKTGTDDVTWDQVREHYKTFSKDNIQDVADAILASDAEDENNQDRYILTRSRLNSTLSNLHAAGSDTTHKTLLWLILYMCAYPNVQDKVHSEIDDVVGKSHKIDLNDKQNLVYTNAVINEVMRMVTQMPFALPHYAIKDGEIQGVPVATGAVVVFNLYSVHHEKDFWGDPENFRPERFILENHSLDKEKCNHVLPFSVGRRRCIGEFFAKMNVFLSFATLMQMCKFVAPPEDRLELSPIPGLVYTAKDFKCQVLARD